MDWKHYVSEAKGWTEDVIVPMGIGSVLGLALAYAGIYHATRNLLSDESSKNKEFACYLALTHIAANDGFRNPIFYSIKKAATDYYGKNCVEGRGE